MASASTTKLYGEDADVNEATLRVYLKDRTFVEYFNSFLLLPAFSNHLYFNSETGSFDPVYGGRLVAWGDSGGLVTPTSSQTTLYLTDEAIGPLIDRQQSWSWVVQHRLPLFKKSDLYSEYKLCKMLTMSEVTVTKSKSCIALPSKSRKSNTTSRQNQRLRTEEADTLPPLDISPSSSKMLLKSQGSVPALVSSPRLIKSHSVVSVSGGQTKQKIQRTVSHNPTKNAQVKLSADDLKLIGNKSGMNALWRFLRGKAGEKNWLFWLDAERLKCCTKPDDEKRVLKEIRERYLLPTGLHKLPAETRNQFNVNKTSGMTLVLAQELQMMLVEGIKDYWLPRFLLHHQNEMIDIGAHHPHSYSAPEALQVNCSSSSSQESLTANYPRVTTPFTPSVTPTFRRLKPSSQLQGSSSGVFSNSPKRSAPESRKLLRAPTYHGFVPLPVNEVDNTRTRVSFKPTDHIRPHTVDGSLSLPPRSPTKGTTRKVWDRSGLYQEENLLWNGESTHGGNVARSSVGRKDNRKVVSAVNLTQVAKYTLQRLPDPNCRCASSMDYNPSQDNMCESRCQIISVAGTPVPPPSLLPVQSHHSLQTPERSLYQSLIRCLNIEHRKAGGYFQGYLDELEDKTYLHCLFFWQNVQKYKAVFVSNYFSPCSVEMKAKEIFGRYIALGCIEFIGCSSHIVSTVCSNLWPAYEDLFDIAEEHCLSMLLVQWVELCAVEDQIFQSLATVSLPESGRSSRHGHATDGVTLQDWDEEEEEEMLCYDGEVEYNDSGALQRPKSSSPAKLYSRPQSRGRMGLTTPSLTAGTSTPSSLVTSSCQLQGRTQPISLNDIMKNRAELEYFKIFLNEHLAAQDLMCWMEIEAFRGVPVSNKAMRDLKAKQLRSRYLNKKYFFGPSSPANKEQQRQVVQAGGGGYGSRLPVRPGTPVLREAQKYVRRRLEKKWLNEFLSSPEFIARNGGDLTEHMNGGKASNNSTNAYEKSFANSHEAILLRKILQNKRQCDLFQKYLMIEVMGGLNSSISHPKNDIKFWIEVQRYKEMCHAHTTNMMLQNKVQAIVDCYIQSSSLPKLQIDVPHAIADFVIRKAPGPYIFREAQATVFKHLATCWESYQNFISGLTESEIVVALSKMERQLQAALEVNKERQELQKSEMEQIKNAVPRFETQTEKEERLKKEKEDAEFGQVAIAFNLTKPNPGYTYFTELPEDGQVRIQLQSTVPNHSATGLPSSKKQTPREQATQPDISTSRGRTDNHFLREKRNSKIPTDTEWSVVAMTLDGDRYASKTSFRRQSSANMNYTAFASSVDSNQHVHFQRQKSSKYFFKNKKGTNRLTRKETSKNSQSASAMKKLVPHSTISMRHSGLNGTPYIYGSGLPEDQTSHLSILATT